MDYAYFACYYEYSAYYYDHIVLFVVPIIIMVDYARYYVYFYYARL